MALYAFDGTWNIDDADDVLDTNVVAFKDLYMGNVCYIEGVGTRTGAVGRVLGGIFGFGGHTRIDEMTRYLISNWEEGDEVIDVVGFSRGAALAVHFTNQLSKDGITLSNGSTIKPTVRFLGLWDVVGSFGLSFDTFINFNEINLGWDIDRVSSTVKQCFHAMALDERRETFGITRLNEDRSHSNIQEVWFRGVHSDVGGGNNNRDRSNIALQWMLDKAIASGIRIDKIKRGKLLYSHIDPFSPISENKDVKQDPRRKVLDHDEVHSTAKSRILDEGEIHVTEVHSKLRYNYSAVRLVKGQTYRISSPPEAKWHDKDIECNADGWKSEDLTWYKEAIVEKFEQHRRVPNANWFELIGSYGDEDEFFRLGTDKQFVAEKDADLYLFANDLNSKYDNNNGHVTVSVTRLS